jgi:hypothetical protein
MTKVCNGITYILKPNRDIYNSTSNIKIGDGASLIRNENDHLIKIAFDGSLYLYSGTPNSWELIKQIVTQHGVSYVVKPDNSLWALSLNSIKRKKCR